MPIAIPATVAAVQQFGQFADIFFGSFPPARRLPGAVDMLEAVVFLGGGAQEQIS